MSCTGIDGSFKGLVVEFPPFWTLAARAKKINKDRDKYMGSIWKTDIYDHWIIYVCIYIHLCATIPDKLDYMNYIC